MFLSCHFFKYIIYNYQLFYTKLQKAFLNHVKSNFLYACSTLNLQLLLVRFQCTWADFIFSIFSGYTYKQDFLTFSPAFDISPTFSLFKIIFLLAYKFCFSIASAFSA